MDEVMFKGLHLDDNLRIDGVWELGHHKVGYVASLPTFSPHILGGGGFISLAHTAPTMFPKNFDLVTSTFT